MKKYTLLIIILFFLNGCSYIELNDLGIINTIGIEKQNDTYKMYATIIFEDKDKSKFIELEENSIQKIIDNLKLSLNKKIYLSHLDLLIINDTIKNKELEEIINFFINNNDARNDFLTVFSDNIKDTLSNSTYKEINNLIKINEKETSKAIYTTMNDIMNNYYNQEPIYLSKVSSKIEGTMMFYHNKYQEFNNDDTIFINYLINNVHTYKKSFTCHNNKFLYLEIISSRTNYFQNNLIISNEIKIINNECNLDKKTINKKINNYLSKNLKKFTNKNIKINNTIRSRYETT